MDNQQSNTPQQKPYLIHQAQIPSGEIKERHLVASPTIASGDLLYGDGQNNFIRLPIKTGSTLTVLNGEPTWQAGYTGSITLAKLTAGGTNGTVTVVNGIITAVVAAT